MRDRKHPINIYSFANHGNRTMQLNPNPFVVMPVQRATQQYKQNWVVRLKNVVDLESGSEEISRNASVDAADAVDVNTKTNEKNSTKSAGSFFGKTLKILVVEAARHDDVVHMKRILNQPEFQTSRTSFNCYDVKTRMEITPYTLRAFRVATRSSCFFYVQVRTVMGKWICKGQCFSNCKKV